MPNPRSASLVGKAEELQDLPTLGHEGWEAMRVGVEKPGWLRGHAVRLEGSVWGYRRRCGAAGMFWRIVGELGHSEGKQCHYFLSKGWKLCSCAQEAGYRVWGRGEVGMCREVVTY